MVRGVGQCELGAGRTGAVTVEQLDKNATEAERIRRNWCRIQSILGDLDFVALPATATQNGYLSSSDWTTFNGKMGMTADLSGTAAETAWALSFTSNSTSGADKGLTINQTGTATAGQVRVFELFSNSVSKFYVTNTGLVSSEGAIYATGCNIAPNGLFSSQGNNQVFTLQHRDFSTANLTGISSCTGTYSAASGTGGCFAFKPILNMTGSANHTDLLINRTETSLGSGAHKFFDLQVSGASKFSIRNDGLVIADAPVRMKSYTVATLPTGTTGDRAIVTDATAPAFLGALTGGGAVTCPVFYDGAGWKAG